MPNLWQKWYIPENFLSCLYIATQEFTWKNKWIFKQSAAPTLATLAGATNGLRPLSARGLAGMKKAIYVSHRSSVAIQDTLMGPSHFLSGPHIFFKKQITKVQAISKRLWKPMTFFLSVYHLNDTVIAVYVFHCWSLDQKCSLPYEGNVCFIKICSKLTSVLLLCSLRIFMKQMLSSNNDLP